MKFWSAIADYSAEMRNKFAYNVKCKLGGAYLIKCQPAAQLVKCHRNQRLHRCPLFLTGSHQYGCWMFIFLLIISAWKNCIFVYKFAYINTQIGSLFALAVTFLPLSTSCSFQCSFYCWLPIYPSISLSLLVPVHHTCLNFLSDNFNLSDDLPVQ